MTTFVDSPAPARTTARPSVDYDTFVLRYARAQRANVLLAFVGVALITGGIMYTHGAPMVILVALGLGLAAAGLGGLAIAMGAHADYTRHLAMTTATTYAAPVEASPGVRAFVPSANGAPTIRAGKFKLERATWVKLFETAAAHDDRLTRDSATKVLPRNLYRDWQNTIGELVRLGMVDGEGRITAGGWQWYQENLSPYPNGGEAPTGAYSTPARRTHGAHGAGMVES